MHTTYRVKRARAVFRLDIFEVRIQHGELIIASPLALLCAQVVSPFGLSDVRITTQPS